MRNLSDLNASTNNRLEAQAIEVANKAAEARAKLDEKKKNELLVTHMSRQQQIRWKRERKAQEDVDDKHIATKMARPRPAPTHALLALPAPSYATLQSLRLRPCSHTPAATGLNKPTHPRP